MERIIEYLIEEHDDGIKIEEFLKKKFYTNSALKELKKMEESVLLNGKWVYLRDEIKYKDILTIHLKEDKKSDNIVESKIHFDVVYEDSDLIVINKPDNMPVHPSLNNYDNTLANALSYYAKENGESFVFRCINRLDRDTTGLTIVAKNLISAGILYEAMAKREIKRSYLAIAEDRNFNLHNVGRIELPIARENASLIKRVVDFDLGEEAVSNYEVLERKGDIALVRFRLETGRTHQIRVHLSHIGAPLIGDYLYNEKYFDVLGVRPLLHSYKLEFIHPISRKNLVFEIDLPNDMKKYFDKREDNESNSTHKN